MAALILARVNLLDDDAARRRNHVTVVCILNPTSDLCGINTTSVVGNINLA